MDRKRTGISAAVPNIGGLFSADIVGSAAAAVYPRYLSIMSFPNLVSL